MDKWITYLIVLLVPITVHPIIMFFWNTNEPKRVKYAFRFGLKISVVILVLMTICELLGIDFRGLIFAIVHYLKNPDKLF